MQSVQTLFPKGKVVRDRYVVERLLGKGGFGAVYRVRDRRVRGNIFALKELIDPNKQQRDNFTFECELLKRLDHKALPHVYRVFEDHQYNRVYMLMDYIEGSNLEKLRKRQPDNRFTFRQAMKIMTPIVDALTYIHAQQPPIVHRDVKPSNIVVPHSGEGTILIDFGIAKEYEQDATTAAIRHCSPGYGSPEQYVRGTDTQTDIYALGATFYTLLTGTVPVDALLRLTRLSIQYSDPLEPANTHVPTISVSVVEAIQCAMAINTEDRFATVGEFWQALNDALATEGEDSSVPLVIGPLVEQSAASTHTLAPEVLTPPVDLVPRSPAAPVLPEEPLLRPKHKKRRMLVFPLIALIIIALLSGAIFGTRYGTGILALAHHFNVPTTLPTAQTPLVQMTPTTVPTQSPPSPTAIPAAYPNLVSSYTGDISDQFTHPPTKSSMTLTLFPRNGANISGNFSVGTGLLGNGSFNGKVTTDKMIQFLVPSYRGLLPLFFQGEIQSDGSMSGTYCSYQNAQCSPTVGGYGIWNVKPATLK